MKYAVITCTNGNYAINAESLSSKETAKVSYHGVCQALWNAPDVVTATVMIVDEQLNIVDGCIERITH